MAGPLALVGSGEYTEAMLDVERSLIEGRPPRYVQIPTAAGRESAQRLSYWVELGKEQAARLGVQAVPLVVTERAQADDPAVAAEIAGAGLIYLSGGSPGVLADTLRDTALWRAIVAAWQDGAALAGCSAGAMAMGAEVPEMRNPAAPARPGLGLLPHVRVLPHFDQMHRWMPDVMARPFFRSAAESDGISLIGIDEDTALVGGPAEFTVYGRQSAWLLTGDGREQFPAGARLHLRTAEL
jgi:cyanophycinase